MWILTSLSRPDRIRAVVDSYDWSDVQVLLTLYEGDPKLAAYHAQSWPDSWQLETVPMLGNGPTYNEILRRYPKERFYGFLADDAVLDTPGMLLDLERAAGNWDVAYANDQHHGAALATMPCIGADLVRAVGYLAPDNLTHWAIDNVWTTIGEKLGALRYLESACYTHLNPVWGTAQDDRTYQQARIASFGYESIYRAWSINELPHILNRVRQAMLQEAA